MNSRGRIDFWISRQWTPISPGSEEQLELLWIRYVSSLPLEGALTMPPNEFFDIVVLTPKDYEGLSPEEAYRTGIEMGCFVQSVAIARNTEGPCAIRIPSDRAGRAKAFLEEAKIGYTINWINDDVMLVRLKE